jgi:4-amino-4-deoxy-L-arabinose transferase-like glycosyltransferase
MHQVLDPPRMTAPATEPAPIAGAHPRTALSLLELLVLLAALALAAAVRLPYLHSIPRYTDELQEVLWAVAIEEGQILPLTAVDSYYGPLWSYLLAGLFALFGPSPWLPRLTAMLLAASFVIMTYLFARDVAGRWPAALAAGLMLTSGGHVVINSHTARSNSITPVLTTAALWLVFLALSHRRWDWRHGHWQPRTRRPWLLVPAGLLLGLALQTHLSVIALLPGLGIFALWTGRGLLRSGWPYLAAAAVPIGYVNMIIFNLQNDFWSFRHASSLQAGYSGGRATDPTYYLTNLGALVQSLARLLSGTIDVPDSPARYLYAGAALAGLLLLTRRGGLLLCAVALSVILVLPYFNPRYGPILSGRYLIPLLPIGYLAVGCLVVAGARLAARGTTAPWQPIAAIAGLLLVLFPLLPLRAYYAEAVADRRTNEPLHLLAAAVETARAPAETVLLDEGLAQEELGAGGNDLKALRMLLATRAVPYRVAKVGELDLAALADRPSVLLVAETKKRSALPRALRPTLVSPEVESASGSEHEYAVYRLTRRDG